MSKKHKDLLLLALADGKSYTWTVPDGGDLASMRKAIKHRQTLTMSPITDPAEIKVGDMVLVKWHQGTIFHLVGEIQGDRYLIINSLGAVNGWVSAAEILGRVTKIVEPEPRPDVPALLDKLEAAYHELFRSEEAAFDEAWRLSVIVDDLRWYANRIGAERWDEMARSNRWTFHQNLWWLIRRARKADTSAPDCLFSLIDDGKRCVGLASEIYILFEHGELD